MFEVRGPVETVRRFTPPRPVVIDMSSLAWAFPMVGHRPATLSERAFGVRVEPRQDGEQLAWVLSSRGVWMALVRTTIGSMNGAVAITSCFWLPASAIHLPAT